MSEILHSLSLSTNDIHKFDKFRIAGKELQTGGNCFSCEDLTAKSNVLDIPTALGSSYLTIEERVDFGETVLFDATNVDMMCDDALIDLDKTFPNLESMYFVKYRREIRIPL